MGEAFLVRRGGVANFKGKQVVNIFIQPDEPIPQNVGDIWIVTDKPITDIIFQDNEPSSPNNMQGLIKVADSELKINIQHALEFLNLSGSHIIVTYPALNAIESISPDKIKLWANAYMEMFVRLGTMKYWDGSSNRWVYNRALYWTGSEWRIFSFTDYYIHVGYNSTEIICKFDQEGNSVWTKTPSANACYGLTIDPNGYIYSGHTNGYVCKLDPDGNTVWVVRPESGVAKTEYHCFAIAVDSEGCIYTAHYDTYHSYDRVFKLDPDGNIIWMKSPTSNRQCNCIAVTHDKYVYIGYANGHVYKLAPNGDLVWVKQAMSDHCKAVAIDLNGYIYSGHVNGYVCKLDADGNIIWQKQPATNACNSIVVDPSGNIYAGYDTGYIYKLDSEGNTIWSKQLVSNYNCSAVDIDPEGYVYAVHLGGYIYKLDTAGNVLLSKQPNTRHCYALAVYPKLAAFPHLW